MIKYNLISDKTIFISQWLKNYFMMKGMNTRNGIVIDNACDRSLFKPDYHIRKPNDPLKIVTHHFSPNMAKGYDYYEKLSEFCNAYPDVARFRFIGNAPDGYLRKTQIFTPQNYIDMPKYIQDQDVYISATQFESGGYHMVEGMACGLVPMIRFGAGGPLNYAYNYCISFENIEDMIHKVKGLYNNYDMYQYLHNKVESEYTYSSDDMCKKYLDVINATANDKK
jgi:glycosyltransferase involved in cell wall biosynthesis